MYAPGGLFQVVQSPAPTPTRYLSSMSILRFWDRTAVAVLDPLWAPRPISSRFGMPSLLASAAAAEPAPEAPEPEEPEEPEVLEELEELEELADELVEELLLAPLLPLVPLLVLPPKATVLSDEPLEVAAGLVLEPPPQALKFRHAAAAAATSSGRKGGCAMWAC